MAAAAATPALAATTRDSGVRGQVTAGPTCPVEDGSKDCAPRPIAVSIAIHRLPGHELVKVVHSGQRGRFRAWLRPGRYRLRPHPDHQAMSCRTSDATVKAHELTHVGLGCDTGLR